MGKRAIFLDRDGVLIEDKGYVYRVRDIEILPGVAEALTELKRAGWMLVVVTNQSGIGRGFYGEADYRRVMSRLHWLLSFDASYHCPHTPEDGCECRKPKPGMLLKAARELDIDLSRSIMIGDKASDIEAGKAAGCRLSVLGGHEALHFAAQHVPEEPVSLLDPRG